MVPARLGPFTPITKIAKRVCGQEDVADNYNAHDIGSSGVPQNVLKLTPQIIDTCKIWENITFN
eukprot:7738855-Prorocentrum_lima.AAC.1